jgi:hypothetical protein
LIVASIRSEYGPRQVGQIAAHHYEEYFLYVDAFSGRDGRSLWWQRMPLGLTEYAAMTGTIGEMLWWGDVTRSVSEGRSEKSSATLARDSLADASGYMAEPRLVIPVHRHPDTQADGGTHSIYVLNAATGRIEHQADDLAFPKIVDWNNDGLDDLAVFAPDDPVKFEQRHHYPDTPTGKFVVLRGSPPEAFRRLDRWVEEQDFDGDGIADLSRSMGGMGVDYGVQIASGRDGHIMAKWKTEWPETPRSGTVGEAQSFPVPLGDFDGDGLADLLLTRESRFWEWEDDPRVILRDGKVPLLIQAISSKTGRRAWGGPSIQLPEQFRPKNADDFKAFDSVRNHYVQPTTTQAVDFDRDGRPELLQTVQLMGQRPPVQVGGTFIDQQQQFLVLIDGRNGSLRWTEPMSELHSGDGYWRNSSARTTLDASADLNADGTLDVLLLLPRQKADGSWTGDLQAHDGRDGKRLWGPVAFSGSGFNTDSMKLPQIGDLDGDGKPELVLLDSKQPMIVKVLRGDSGEARWTWNGALPPYTSDPSVVIVQSSPVAPRQESRTSNDTDRANDAVEAKNENSALGNSSRGARRLRCVAVTNTNETGNQWELVLLDHAGQVVERVPYNSNQLWSHDLDGDGGEELLRYEGTKLIASHGLHEVLWTWTRPPSDYGWISRFDRAPDGRALVVTAGADSITLLDGPTGKPIARSWRSTNTSLQENNRMVDLNHMQLAESFENSRLLTRVGDGPVMLDHVVSRAVLPTDEDGRYSRGIGFQPVSPKTQNVSKQEPERTHDRLEAYPTRDDPRLVRQLIWAPTPAEWAARRREILKDILLPASLSLVVVLIPYWLIRAGIRRRDLGRWRAALIAPGTILFLACLALLRFPPPGAMWRNLPWALPFVMSVGGLPILLYPAALFGALANGNWRRVRRLLIGTLALTAVLAAIQMGIDLSQKPPEQHYSWFGWWMIFVMGAYFTGGCLVLGHAFGPSVRWLWMRVRGTSAATAR